MRYCGDGRVYREIKWLRHTGVINRGDETDRAFFFIGHGRVFLVAKSVSAARCLSVNR